jgi:hypothetical protein
MIQPVLGPQPCDGGAKAVDDRQAARRRQQVGKTCKGALASRTEALADVSFGKRPAGCGRP